MELGLKVMSTVLAEQPAAGTPVTVTAPPAGPTETVPPAGIPAAAPISPTVQRSDAPAAAPPAARQEERVAVAAR
jgi:hypothetical protein